MGNPRSIHRIQCILKDLCPQVVFFIETKLDNGRMEKVRKRMGFVNGIDIQVVGSRYGLSLGWKQDCSISLQRMSDSHIDMIVLDNDLGLVWLLTDFRGTFEKHWNHAS